MTYEVELKELPARPVATIRVTVETSGIGKAFGELLPQVMAHIKRHGAHPVGPPLGIFHHYGETSCDMEAGWALEQAIPSEGPVDVRELPAGRAAVTWHFGPYSTLGDAHRTVIGWISSNGREQTGPPWELYWSDPQEVPPEELRTEVGYPVD